jgi:restriction endonuclease Mrr
MKSERIVGALRDLAPRYEKTLRMRYGIGCDRPYTLHEIAQEFDVPVARIRTVFTEATHAIQSGARISSQELRSYGRWEQSVRRERPIAVFPVRREQLAVESAAARLLNENNISREMLLSLKPRDFEELIAEIWHNLGYRVELTARTRDGGRDVVAVRRAEAEVRYLIECKRYDPEHKVGVQFVRALYGVKVDDKATKAFLATTSSFTRDALKFCENHRWELEPRDYEGVSDWLEMAGKYQRRPDSGLYVPNSQ